MMLPTLFIAISSVTAPEFPAIVMFIGMLFTVFIALGFGFAKLMHWLFK